VTTTVGAAARTDAFAVRVSSLTGGTAARSLAGLIAQSSRRMTRQVRVPLLLGIGMGFRLTMQSQSYYKKHSVKANCDVECGIAHSVRE
jgi:hypothetical protein